MLQVERVPETLSRTFAALVMKNERRGATPAMLTGTSSEYLGRRPLPHVMRERPVLVIVGPAGSGKTSVARHVAGHAALYLDTPALNEATAVRVRVGRWNEAVLEAAALVIDEPVWLHKRPAYAKLFAELLVLRVATHRRTIVCQQDSDASIAEVLGALPPGTGVTLGLRFPRSRQGRLRFALRVCELLGLPAELATGTERVDAWDYRVVIAHLQAHQQVAREG